MPKAAPVTKLLDHGCRDQLGWCDLFAVEGTFPKLAFQHFGGETCRRMARDAIGCVDQEIEHDAATDRIELTMAVHPSADLNQARRAKALSKCRAEGQVDARLNATGSDERPILVFRGFQTSLDASENDIAVTWRKSRGQVQYVVTGVPHRASDHGRALNGVENNQPRTGGFANPMDQLLERTVSS
jgi:hypothetical protein